MKYLVFLFSLILFNSCSTRENLIGLYGKCGKKYYVCDQLELKSDNTFEFYSFMDVGGGKVVKGFWKKISNDTIMLNSFERPQNSKTKILGKVNSESKNISVKIIERGNPLIGSVVTINNQSKISDENGIVIFDNQKVKSITYQFLNNTERIEIDNSDYNDFELKIKDLEYSVNSSFFVDKVLIFKNRKILINDKLILKKTTIKHKQWN